MRVLQYLTSPSRLWAIEEGAWQEMKGIVEGQNLTLESIEASLGKMDNQKTNSFQVVDGVAVIPVIGPIVKYGNLFSQVSGMTSVSKLTTDFNDAIANQDVKAILFDIDSPGGEANGINEFAEQIYQARGDKPIQAYISGQGCSAAYWIASACDPDGIFLDETAVAGSIGVAVVAQSNRLADEKAGITTHEFVSEGSERKRPDLETEEGKDVIMERINSLAQVFRTKVARNRSNDSSSLTVRDVIEKFNRGGVLMGDDAVRVGLANGISSRNEVLQNLISKSTAIKTEERVLEKIQENIMEEQQIADQATILELTEKVTLLTGEKETLATSIAEATTQIASFETEFAKINSEKALVQDENLTLKANAKAAELSNKMVPAQKDGFVKGYILAAKDDISNPIQGTNRLDTFLGMFESAENHSLEEEALDPDNLELMNSENQDDDNGLAALLASARAHAAKQNSKEHGSN